MWLPSLLVVVLSSANLQGPPGAFRTTMFNIQELWVLPSQCIYVLHRSQNKQRLFPYTALTDRFLYPKWSVFTARYDLVFKYTSCQLPSSVRFPLPVSFYQCSILNFIYTQHCCLSDGQTGKARETSRRNYLSEIGENWIEKCFHLASKF